jgi:murein DD-endopeptidase MepM/ murein hydrolase activator NlpD
MTDPVLRIVVVPATKQSRTYEVSYRRLYLLRGLGVVLGTVVAFMIATYGYMVSRHSHMLELEAQVEIMRAEQERIPALLRRLSTVEGQYADMRDLFAPDGTGAPSELWLPPPESLSRSSGSDEGRDGNPDGWPLTEPGFITQRLDDGGRAHPGLDIAIPTGSYIRAAGAGRVMEVGEEDPVFGKYVRIDHQNGYVTLYAHASHTSVELGEEVRKSEVIALSGSTGESTAPHLHFEILLEGETVDPLELVRQP